MKTFIYSENGKYFYVVTDLIGRQLDKFEISKKEYLRRKENYYDKHSRKKNGT